MREPKYDREKIISLCDGNRTSKEIAEIVGCPAKYVQKMMRQLDLPRRPRGGPTGDLNGSWRGGRTVDLDGYALVPAPYGHVGARVLPGRNKGRILEHRLVMEQKIGRPLLSDEVVDHIDGMHLHNDPENLRLFPSNADHLRETLSGKCPQWSANGLSVLRKDRRQRQDHGHVDIYQLRKKRGDVRLQQILLAALSLGTDSPHLSGTHRYMEQNGIDWRSRPSLERALRDLESRYAQDLCR